MNTIGLDVPPETAVRGGWRLFWMGIRQLWRQANRQPHTSVSLELSAPGQPYVRDAKGRFA